MENVKKLMHPFVDPLGRPSDKPNTLEHGLTDNPILFMGQLIYLLSRTNKLTPEIRLEVATMLSTMKIQDGLYSRHPKSLIEKYNWIVNRVSHDEYVGLMLLSIYKPSGFIFRNIASEVISYGEKHHWQYNDLHPNSDFFRSLKESPLKTLEELRDYIKDLKSNPDNTNSVDLFHEGDIVALASIRQPRDTGLYKISDNRKISWIETIWMIISMLLSTRAEIHDGSRGGTMLLTWFRNRAIVESTMVGIKMWLLNKAVSWFDRRMINKYGKQYPLLLADSYWDLVGANGERNFLITLVREYMEIYGTR